MAKNIRMLEKHRASMKIEDSIKSTTKIFDKYLQDLDFDQMMTFYESKADSDVFYSYFRSLFVIHRALFTFDEEALNAVPITITHTIDMCNKFRRKGVFDSILGVFKTPDYNKYEEIEIHAEMIYAMMQGYYACMGFITCSNVIQFLNLVNRLWLSERAFSETKLMHKRRKHWLSESSRLEFESALHLEMGFKNIFISYCPPKLLRLINFIGLKGCRSRGFSELEVCALDYTGIYSKCAEYAILVYWMYVEVHGCLGPKNLNFCQKLIDRGLDCYPNCFFYKFLSNRLNLLNGNIKQSIDGNKQLLSELNNYLYPKICDWELMWSYALLCDWERCVYYAHQLFTGSKHSPALFTHMEAIFCYTKGREENKEHLIDKASKLLEQVPALSAKYLGKTITYEKSCIDSSKLFFKNNNFLLFPVMDMLYNGNMFYIIDGNIECLERFMSRVDSEVNRYVKTLETDKYVDNYLHALFNRGVIFKHMGKFQESKQCFENVLKEKHRISTLTSIPPQSLLELAVIEMEDKNYEKSKELINKVLNKYNNYVSEHIVHIRCYSALRQMGVNTDVEDVDKVDIVKEFANSWLMSEEGKHTDPYALVD